MGVNRRAGLWAGVVGPIVLVGTFLVLGVVRPGYDPTRHLVSLLSLGDGGWVQIASFIITGALLVVFAVSLRATVRGGRGAAATPIAIAASGLGLILAGAFSTVPSYGFPPGAPDGLPKDLPASAYVHVVGGLLFFFGLVIASLIQGRQFRRIGTGTWAVYSIITGVVVLVSFGLSGAGPSGELLVPPLAGLLQRIAIVGGLGWVLAIALLELRGDRQSLH